MIVRRAGLVDVMRLEVRMRPWDASRLWEQFGGSAPIALCSDAGEVFAAGGIYPDYVKRQRVCWMFVGPRPPARDLVDGVRAFLWAANVSRLPPLAAYIDARVARDLRFAGFLGFEARPTGAAGHPPTLPAHILRMEWAG